MYVMSNKLKNLKVRLKRWNKEVYGNVNSLVFDAENSLQDIQNKIQTLGPSLESSILLR